MNNQMEFVKYVQSLLSKAQNVGPQQVIQELYQKNPAAARDVQDILNNGGSIQNAAMTVLQRQGIDPSIFTGRK